MAITSGVHVSVKGAEDDFVKIGGDASRLGGDSEYAALDWRRTGG